MAANRWLLLLPICAGSCVGRGGFERSEGDWWDEAWHLRRQVELDNTQRVEELRDFPVLIELPTGFDYANAAADGRDLRFVDDEEQTCPHEVESWRPGATTVIWVRAPPLPGGARTRLWLYYGNAAAPALADAATVWAADHGGVWHLGADLADSTASGPPADNVGSTVVDGAIGDGRAFDGSSRIGLGLDRDTLRNVSAATLSLLARAETFGEPEPHLVGFTVYTSSPPTTASRAAIVVTQPGTMWGYARAADSDSLGILGSPPGTLELGRFYHLAVVIDYAADRMALFIDGGLVAERQPFGFSQPRTSDTPSTGATLACDETGHEDFFTGTLDEVRVARVARSADWIAAEHSVLMRRGFVTLGAAERF
jgi:biopolymer transport protein ExbB